MKQPQPCRYKPGKAEPSCDTIHQVSVLQVVVTVCGMTKTTGYIRLGPHMPDIILVKQEMDYELTGEQVTPSPTDGE